MGWPLALRRCWKTLSYSQRNQRKELVEAFHRGCWNEWPPASGILKSQRLWLESSWPQFDHMPVTGYMAPWEEGSFHGPCRLSLVDLLFHLDWMEWGKGDSFLCPPPTPQIRVSSGKETRGWAVQMYKYWLQLGAEMCLRNLGMNTCLNLMLRCSKSPAHKTLSSSSQNLEKKKNSKAIKGLYFNVYYYISQLFCRINFYQVTWKWGQIFP